MPFNIKRRIKKTDRIDKSSLIDKEKETNRIIEGAKTAEKKFDEEFNGLMEELDRIRRYKDDGIPS